MKEIINHFQNKFDANEIDFTAADLVDLAKLILENNYFEFDGNIYRQKLSIRT